MFWNLIGYVCVKASCVFFFIGKTVVYDSSESTTSTNEQKKEVVLTW